MKMFLLAAMMAFGVLGAGSMAVRADDPVANPACCTKDKCCDKCPTCCKDGTCCPKDCCTGDKCCAKCPACCK